MKHKLKKALIIYNPVSGWFPSKNLIFDLISSLSEDNFISEVYMTKKDESTTEILKEIGSDIDKIIVCGGDGTLHDVLNGIIKNNIDIPLGYIPIGTTNDFGSTHNIPRDFNQAYKLIQNEDVKVLDIGKFSKEDYFSYIACFGLFTKSTYEAPQFLKNTLGQLAYFLEGTLELGDLGKSYHMIVKTDSEIIEGNFVFGAVVNSLNFAGIFKIPISEEDLNDGYLEIVLVKLPDNIIELPEVAGSMFSSSYENDKTILLKTKKVEFISQEPVAWNLDGEYAGELKNVKIEVIHSGLKLIYNKEN